MVDVSKVTTGFDVEFVIGAEFFGYILRILYESREIPEEWTGHYGNYSITLTLKPQYDVRLVSAPDGTVLGYTHFNFKARTPAGTMIVPDIELGLAFGFTAVKSGEMVSRVDLEVHLWDLDIPALTTNLPVSQQDYGEDLRNALWDVLNIKVQTGITSGDVQDFFVRAFADTSGTTSALGLYFNYAFNKEPDGSLFGPRGALSDAQNILPSPAQSVAVALNKNVYEMLAAHMKNDFAEADNGGFAFPLYRNQARKAGKIGRLKKIGILPRFFNPLLPQENAMFMIAKARFKYLGHSGDATLRMKVAPILDNGTLRFDTTLDDVDIDVDWDMMLAIPLIVGGIFGFVGAVAGGFFGLFVAAGFYGTLAASAQQAGIKVGEGMVRDSVESAIEKDIAPLSVIPRQLTILTKRWDPFFHTHYQIMCAFDACDVLFEGITATGHPNGTTTTDQVYRDISIIEAVRDGDGNIIDLIYEVGKSGEIENPAGFRRPPGLPPGQFVLSIAEAKHRISQDHLRSTVILNPTHVCIRNHQIAYIKFDIGLVLSPQEAGELQVATILGVWNYKLIRIKRENRFYYRSKPDVFEHNNLSNLPRFDPSF